MEESILASIKKMIGGDTYSTEFDTDLIIAINSVISTLYQLGIETVDETTGNEFQITGESEFWSDYLKDYKYLDMVKGYIYQRVRLMFDPPQNSFLVNAIQDQLKETEWRIIVAVESENSNQNE